MALVSMNELMEHALKNHYAVGYFEAWNMESILAVTDAATKMNSPVIIGFGGQFIESERRTIRENIRHYGALGLAIAKDCQVPVALLLNEGRSVELLVQGLNSGFNAIMLEAHDMPMEEFISVNRALVKKAHAVNASVEAEIGRLPDADIANGTVSTGYKTDPDEAIYFVSRAGVDALAVSVGNVHLLESAKAPLDFDLIKCLRKKINVPLVLHGATGISTDDLQHAVSLGMCKVNVGTALKRAYLNYIRNYFAVNNINAMDPHNIIGRGGKIDMLSGARAAVADEVTKFIKILGSENKAQQI